MGFMNRMTEKALSDLPNTVYKVRTWNDEFHKNVLLNQELWISSIPELNDPYDCCIPIRYDQKAKKILKEDFDRLLLKSLK